MNEQDPTADEEDPAATQEESAADEPLPEFPPPGVAAPEGSTLDAAGEIRLAATNVEILGPFWFCFNVNGRKWGEQAIYAPGPDEAALTAQQMAAIYQALLRNAGYRDVVVGVTAGRCV